MVYYDTNTIIPYMYQISRIRTCIIARPESVPHHSAIICAVPLLLYCSLYTYPLGYRDPSVLALITPTLLTILYLSSAIYIYSFSLRYPLSLPLYYLYLYFSYFYLFLYFYSLLSFYFYLYYSLDLR